ncbi:hypothetical protein TUM20984_45520 [Mycobacterium antarcticum]|nr:hypothetical protein TUM20984_45520 [Mycolicibacterium sp. TUM20984]
MSTSATASDHAAAGGGKDLSAAQPTPIWRCGSSPDNHETITATVRASSCPATLSRLAICITFVNRDEEVPTSTEALTTSISNTVSA